MSLDECLQMALSNNENLKNSILEENVSKMTSREYLSVGFPQIQFETGLKYNFVPPGKEDLYPPAPPPPA